MGMRHMRVHAPHMHMQAHCILAARAVARARQRAHAPRTSSGSATSAEENLVGTMPGATQLTVTPRGPSSAARPLVSPSSAVLLTAYMAMGAGGLRACVRACVRACMRMRRPRPGTSRCALSKSRQKKQQRTARGPAVGGCCVRCSHASERCTLTRTP
jgi:hypothetical protein